MRTRRQRNADVKLIVAATVAVLLAGFVIGAGIFVATNSDERVACGRLPVGAADSIREDLEGGGPFFQSGGANCNMWLALEDGDIVAYRAEQESGCSLDLERGAFVCDGASVDPVELDRFPVSIETRGGTDTVIVDVTGGPTSTTAPSTSTTTG